MAELDFTAVEGIDFSPVFQRQKAATTSAVMGGNADAAAKSVQVGKELGVPAPVVALDPQGAETTLRTQKASQLVELDPAYAKLIEESPLAAELTLDDWDNLRKLQEVYKDRPAVPPQSDSEGTLSAFGRGITEGYFGTAYGRKAFGYELGDGSVEPELRQFEERGQKDKSSIINSLGQMLGGIAGSLPAAAKGAVAGAIVGAPWGGVGAVPGAVAGAVAGFAVDQATVAAGTAYRQLDLAKDVDGNSLPEPVKQVGALATGIVAGALNAVGGEQVSAAVRPFITEAMIKALQQPVMQNLLVKSATEIGKAGLTGGALNAAAQFATTMIPELAKASQGPEFATVFNDPVLRKQLIESTVEAGVTGFVALGALRSFPVGVSYVTDRIHIEQARRSADQLDQAFEALTESKTRERDPDTFAQYAKNLIGDQTVSLPAELVAKSPEAFHYVDDLQTQLEQALPVGGDVVVPEWQFIAHTDPKDYAALREHVRQNDGLTLEEADELDKSPPNYMTVWHGSPHVFDKFDISKIGTGEGNQSFGRGLYLAENKAVAESYQDSTSQGRVNIKVGDTTLSVHEFELHEAAVQVRRGDKEGALRYLDDYDQHVAQFGPGPETTAMIEAGKRLREGIEKDEPVEFEPAKGNLYEVALKLQPDEILDYDLPMKSQSDRVKELFRQNGLEVLVEGDMKGRDAYDELYRTLPEKYGTPDKNGMKRSLRSQALAELLRDAGIKAVRYADAFSRDGKAEPTNNLVVFDDKLLEIIKRNDEVLAQNPEGVLRAKSLIDKVREGLWLGPVATPKALSMTVPQFTRYSKHLQELQRKITQGVFDAAHSEIRKIEGKLWKENLALELEAAKKEIYNSPTYAADRYLRLGETPNGKLFKVNLDPAEIEALGLDPAALPRAMLGKADRLPLDDVSELFGFANGRAMVESLAALERVRQEEGLTPAKHLDAVIKDRAKAQMELKYGKFDENVMREAMDLAMSVEQIEVLLDEYKALGGNETLTAAKVIKFTEEKFGEYQGKIAARAAAFERAASKYGYQAEMGLLKGKAQDAFLAKQRQLGQLLLLKESRAFVKDMQSLMKSMKSLKVATIGALDQPFLDQIHSAMMQLGFSVNRDAAELRRGLMPTEKFVEALDAKGYDIEIPEFMRDGQSHDFKSLTVNEIRDFKDYVQGLDKIGREQTKVFLKEKKLELNEMVDQAKAELASQPGKTLGDGKIPSFFRGIDASLLRMEKLFDWFGGRKADSPFNNVFAALSAAKIEETERLRDLSGKLKVLFDREWSKTVRRKIDNSLLMDPSTGKPMTLTKGNLLVLAANLGNDGNKARLLGGYGWDEADVIATLNANLTKDDWRKVQGIWKIFEGMWPDADRLARDMSGVGLRKVEPTTVSTAHGDFEGGYYPIIYEKRGWRPDEFLDTGPMRLTPKRNYTKARAENLKDAPPVDLTFEALPHALMEVVHDLSFRQPLAEARKFLNRSDLRQAISEKFGDEYVAQIDPWLNAIAGDARFNHKGTRWWDQFLRKTRLNLTTASLALRVSSLLDFSPLLAAADAVGGKNVLAAMGRYMTHPREMFEFATKNSDELRNRMWLVENNVHDGMADLLGKNDLLSQARRVGYYGFAGIDAMMAVPLWHVGYEQALRKGLSHGDAVAYGDKLVRGAQGSGHNVDLPAILRDSEAMKFMTMFYSWFNVVYNNLRDAPRGVKTGVAKMRAGEYAEARTDLAMVMSRTFYWMFMMAASDYLIRGAPGKEDEDYGARFAKQLALQTTSTIPFLRDVGQQAWGDFGSPPTANVRIAQEAFRAGNDAMAAMGLNDKDVSDKWLKHAIQTPGYIFGVPGSAQAGISAQFLWDLSTGEQVADGLDDVLRGLIWGNAEKTP